MIPPARRSPAYCSDVCRVAITYGMCLACRSVEVALNTITGTRDFSDIGESDTYPVGYGCEVCA